MTQVTDLRQRVRLLSYNIQVGMASVAPSHYLTGCWKHLLPHAQLYENLHRIADAINNFDIVALQEVDAGSLRSSFINQIQFLANRGGFPYWYHQINREIGILTKHSNGVLSKYQPLEVDDYKLPGRIPGRGAMVVRYGNPHDPLVLITLHLALGKRTRKRQLEFVSEIVNCYDHVVVMGDMNCQPGSAEMNYLLETTNLVDPEHGLKTFPSWKPSRRLDHILASPSLEIHDVHVLDHVLSDHLPIAMELSLPADMMLAA
ncbi:MAG: endonuclease/exonuclease/phosphatase family protein [Gammaproteobacteria bacterium]|nr:endonuclease/exonuclease/phosphatase family protein [Gammaproteobacteria bacterium]MDH5801555.1 endonuclease/exonuclease/phosphatase family protein [Gammaproteobacteria bacterium]